MASSALCGYFFDVVTMITFYRAVGAIAVVLAVLGAFLPLLPTTPFVLLASACFARSSPRLHAWLRRHRLFGGLISDYENGRGVPIRTRLIAAALMWASLLWSMTRFQQQWVWVVLAAIGVGVSIILYRLPRPQVATRNESLP